MISEGYVGLQFIMKHGAFFRMIMSSVEANGVIQLFSTKDCPEFFTGMWNNLRWVVKSSEVACMHLISREDLLLAMQQQGQQPDTAGLYNRSGGSRN